MGNLNFSPIMLALGNGSYGKLLKTYYAKQQDSGTETSSKEKQIGQCSRQNLGREENPKVSKEVQEANANLTTGLSNLRNSVSALQRTVRRIRIRKMDRAQRIK